MVNGVVRTVRKVPGLSPLLSENDWSDETGPGPSVPARFR
jgi:hypothetical protein